MAWYLACWYLYFTPSQIYDCHVEKNYARKEVKIVTGKSRSSIYEGMANGSFPAQEVQFWPTFLSAGALRSCWSLWLQDLARQE